MSVSGSINLQIGIIQAAAFDLSAAQDNLSSALTPINTAFTNGTGANKAGSQYHDNVTLAKSASTELNLTDDSLTDKFGEAITFTFVKAIFIRNNSSDATIIYGHSAATPLPIIETTGDGILIGPGGFDLKMFAGTGYAAAGANLLKIEDDGTGAAGGTVDIFILGEVS